MSDGQEKALALVPLLPALMSVLSDITLLRLLKKSNFRSPYRRILFIMSAVDTVNSIRIALGPFLVPTQSRRIWAIGNAQTCRLLGITTQLIMPSFMYYCFLSIYFMLHIRYNVRDRYFGRYIEPFIHAFGVVYAVIPSIVFVALNLIGENNFGNGCWINPNPSSGCGTECVALLQWLIMGVPFSTTFLVTVLCNILIVAHVRSTTNTSRRHSSLHVFEGGGGGNQHQTRRINKVASQALLYVLVYYLTYIWTFAVRTMAMFGYDTQDEASIFWLLLIRSFFHPLMGFGNLLVYIRPRYQHLRSLHPEQSRWKLFRQAFVVRPPSEEILHTAASPHRHRGNFSSYFMVHHHHRRQNSRINNALPRRQRQRWFRIPWFLKLPLSPSSSAPPPPPPPPGQILASLPPKKLSKDSSNPLPLASRNGERHTNNSCVELPEEEEGNDVDTSVDLGGGLVGKTVQVPNDQPPFVISSYCLDSDDEGELGDSRDVTRR